MYLHKVRKSPLEGFNVNLSTSQMVAVLILFLLFFVGPIVGYNKVRNTNQPQVAGIYTNTITTTNSKKQFLTIVNTAAISSSVLLLGCVGIVMNDYYKKNKLFEL